MIQQSFNVELKKIILTHLQTACSIHIIIEELLNNLITISANNETKNSALYTASEYIFAYLDLGFSYLDHKNLFDSILSCAGYNDPQIASFQTQNQPIVLSKAKLRSIIGRWPASPYNSHSITDAINDIMAKSNNDNFGTYHYYTAKKDGEYTALYQLTISPGYILFHDVLHNHYFQLLKK